ncbi:spermatogenesis-associated protein 46 [Chlamydotis macqueenii]
MYWDRASHLCIPWKQRGRVPSTAPDPVGGRALTGTPNLLQALSSTACVPTAPSGSKLPASSYTIYRPWFSPYSYFTCIKGAAQQPLGSLSSSPAASMQEHEEPDDLSEIISSSYGSSDEPKHPRRDKLGSNRPSITVRDILTASCSQPVPQRGYKCVSCCRLFPTLLSVKLHIQHSFQEGYSCKVYYHRLKALWEKEHKEQEAAAPRVPVQLPQAGPLPREGTAPSLLPAAE